MKKIRQIINYNPADRHIYFLLISAPVLLTIYRYFGEAKDFNQYFPSLLQSASGEVYATILQFSGFFLLMFLFPVFYAKYIWKKPLKDFGMEAGDFRWGLLFALISIPVIVLPFSYAGSFQPTVQAEYPLSKTLLAHHELLPIYVISYSLFYYIAWEFFFRGFLLFGLAEKFGGVNAILIQTISSCLVHIDKPAVEIIGSIPVGILFGIVALRTKSFWYVFLVHAAIGISTDLFIIFNHR
ncbi:MAG TPA: CPBP family intramembrane glutamic endopeptidase [Bacteroidia bacterium]|nr:CPBP family intramembrane glutamic endopeptidase [Bacteroidia bacterium]